MSPDFAAALEFAEGADAIDSPTRLQDSFGEIVSRFGITYFSTVAIAVPGRMLQPRFLFGEVVQDWTQRYGAQGYAKIDPSVSALFEVRKPFTWREALERRPGSRGERLLDENREWTRADDGLVVPIHDAQGETAAVILSGPDVEFGPDVRPILHLASVYFSSVGRDLMQAPPHVDECPLTGRQLECLRWVMDGKSDWEIGEILSISERTAHNHVEAAKRQLDVGTRTQAVVQAWRRGWLV